MRTKREANPTLMALWLEEWKTLGRWQALNSRLAREATPVSTGWARRSVPTSRLHGLAAPVSAPG